MLNETIKKELLSKAENIDIDVSTLKSAYWDRNVYAVEPHLAVGEWVYNEDEYYKEQLKTMSEYVKHDGLDAYVALADDEDADGSLTLEASLWLLSMAGE